MMRVASSDELEMQPLSGEDTEASDGASDVGDVGEMASLARPGVPSAWAVRVSVKKQALAAAVVFVLIFIGATSTIMARSKPPHSASAPAGTFTAYYQTTPWPMAHSYFHSNFSPNLHATDATAQSWSVQLDSVRYPFTASIAVGADGLLYTGTDAGMYGIHAATGEVEFEQVNAENDDSIVWLFAVGNLYAYATVLGPMPRVKALDPRTGQSTWSMNLVAPEEQPPLAMMMLPNVQVSIHEHVFTSLNVFHAGADGPEPDLGGFDASLFRLQAFDAASGTRKWTWARRTNDTLSMNTFVLDSVREVPRTVYVFNADGVVTHINATNGAVDAEYAPTLRGEMLTIAINAEPLVLPDGRIVVVENTEGWPVLYDPRTGEADYLFRDSDPAGASLIHAGGMPVYSWADNTVLYVRHVQFQDGVDTRLSLMSKIDPGTRDSSPRGISQLVSHYLGVPAVDPRTGEVYVATRSSVIVLSKELDMTDNFHLQTNARVSHPVLVGRTFVLSDGPVITAISRTELDEGAIHDGDGDGDDDGDDDEGGVWMREGNAQCYWVDEGVVRTREMHVGSVVLPYDEPVRTRVCGAHAPPPPQVEKRAL